MDYLIIGAISALIGGAIVYAVMRSRRNAASDPASVFGAARSVSADSGSAAPASGHGDPTPEQLVIDGDEQYARREYDDALSTYGDALSAAEEQKGHDDLIIAVICEKQGDCDLAVNGGDYDEDTIPTEYLRALSVRDRVQGPFHADVMPVLQKLIGFYDRVGNHREAEGLLRRLREMEEAIERSRRLAQLPPG